MNEQHVEEKDLLLPFEQEVLVGEWKSYFKIKRECWLGSIQRLKPLWNVFIALDNIFVREIEDLGKGPDLSRMVPHLLFIKSHQSVRVAAEVGFSTHFPQAWDITRAAIESAVIAHKIHREPSLDEVWLRKDEGKAQLEAFKDHFERHKKDNLFPNRFKFLTQLHELYAQFSEWGTHTTVMSLATQYRHTTTDGTHLIQVTYTEADLQKIATSLYYLVSAFAYIEEAFYDAYSTRLSLDPHLAEMRLASAANRKAVARNLIDTFKIRGPRILLPTRG